MSKLNYTLSNTKDLIPYANNARTHSEEQVAQIAASIKEFGFINPILVDANNGVIAGHGRLMAARKLRLEQVPTLLVDHLSETQKKAYILADNRLAEVGNGWDKQLLEVELESIKDAGFDLDLTGFVIDNIGDLADDKEPVENSGQPKDSDEYLDFLNKFEEKKTTDDCYTPPRIYDVVRDWAVSEYGLDGKNILRPFRPGGDYQKEQYGDDDVVIDNPPFSIISEIAQWYIERGIKYFLFAPGLTLFSSLEQCHVVTGTGIVYDNGANVPTGFVTNMDEARVRTAPELRSAIKYAIEEGKDTRNIPEYIYPGNVISAARLGTMASAEFSISPSECSRKIAALSHQKEKGKTIFGGGFLISDEKAAELKAAELKAAELKAAELKERHEWALSKDEMEIIESLGATHAP